MLDSLGSSATTIGSRFLCTLMVDSSTLLLLIDLDLDLEREPRLDGDLICDRSWLPESKLIRLAFFELMLIILLECTSSFCI